MATQQTTSPMETMGFGNVPLSTTIGTSLTTRAVSLRDNPPQAVLDAIADCPRGVEVDWTDQTVAIRPLLLWQAALDALVSDG